MTNREFLHNVIAYACDGEDVVNDVNANELISYAQDLLAKLDARNAKRAATPSKTAVANEPIKAKIVELLSDATELMTASQIGEALEISTQKASALLRQMVEVGTLTSEEVKVPKKGKQKGYTLADKD